MYFAGFTWILGHAGKEQLVCVPHHWRCLNNLKCIKESERCNGKYDCEDHSDENYCNVTFTTSAPPAQIAKGKNMLLQVSAQKK